MCMIHVHVVPHDHIYSLVKFRSLILLANNSDSIQCVSNWGDYSILDNEKQLCTLVACVIRGTDLKVSTSTGKSIYLRVRTVFRILTVHGKWACMKG